MGTQSLKVVPLTIFNLSNWTLDATKTSSVIIMIHKKVAGFWAL